MWQAARPFLPRSSHCRRPPASYAERPINVGFFPAESTRPAVTAFVADPGMRTPGSAEGRYDMANAQFVASVLMRLGTSPTGMTALTVLLSVSMAVTDLMAAFEI
jgi:hypothetical protein